MSTHGRAELRDAPRVLLYAKPGCHLCDDARAVVERVCAELGEPYDEVDITELDPDADARGSARRSR